MIRLAAALVLLAGAAAADCRQALALGLDVSGSVDAREYRLQLDGLAAALTSAQVRARLLEPAGAPVRLAVFDWSGPATQRLILPWTAIDGEAALEDIAARLRATERIVGEQSTALGVATTYGLDLLAGQRGCWRRTLDLSGDGPTNAGPRPQDLPDPPADVTINGLVIGAIPEAGDDRAADLRELGAYYEAYVIRGAGAFVEMALGYEDYEAAMRRKLLRELAALAIGSAAP